MVLELIEGQGEKQITLQIHDWRINIQKIKIFRSYIYSLTTSHLHHQVLPNFSHFMSDVSHDDVCMCTHAYECVCVCVCVHVHVCVHLCLCVCRTSNKDVIYPAAQAAVFDLRRSMYQH